jgi:acetylornithine/N-succinyldiaminopimelate aminotransferase
MTLTNEALHEQDKAYYLQTFKRFPLAIAKGEGSRVWDVEGNEYIDMLAGIAVNNVGHCHPKVVKAVQDQAAKLMHISNFFVSEPQVALSKKLVELSKLSRVFFSNSGAESVEGAIKLARKYAFTQGRGGEIIAMEGSFHGRTLATIATGKAQMQHGFGPIPSGFHRVPFNDLEAVKQKISKQTAGIILELIQGEGGINEADEAFVKGLRELCDTEGIALIFDEIQSGVGRTGKWFAKDHYGVQPDIMTLAKGLGGGVPIGAILCNDKVGDAIDFGDHGTTFGGNPLVCAAALASIEAIAEENLLSAAEETGKWFCKQLAALNEPSLVRTKGKGLMLGVEFDFETKDLVLAMLKHRVIANATAGNVLRLVPPLNISREDLEEVLRVLKLALETVK